MTALRQLLLLSLLLLAVDNSVASMRLESSTSERATARVAVASNFIKPMKELVSLFEEQTDFRIIVSYSASGKLFAQITHGAPYHLFLSADQLKPLALIKNQMADDSDRFTYAQGVLILWSADSKLLSNSPDVLHANTLRKIALANPKFAPYGQAAVDVLQSLSLVDQTKAKWVMGESISQTFQFVATGNADIGFISYSQKPDKGSYWQIPSYLYKPIRQDAILLKGGKENPAAIAFFEFIKSNQAKNIIQSHHYKID